MILNDRKPNPVETILQLSISMACFEHITIEKITFIAEQSGIVITNRSYVAIRGSSFLDLKNGKGLIEVTKNSTLVMFESFVHQTPDYCDGGALFVTNSSSHIENVFFLSHFSCQIGVVICLHCYIIIDNTSFVNNTGGAFKLVDYSNAIIHDSKFYNNSVSWYGGLILVQNHCTLVILSVVFGYNRADYIGGAKSASDYSSIKLENSIFLHIIAIEAAGGIYGTNYIYLDIRNTNFTNNIVTVGSGGAVVIAESSYLVISNCFLAHNQVVALFVC